MLNADALLTCFSIFLLFFLSNPTFVVDNNVDMGIERVVRRLQMIPNSVVVRPGSNIERKREEELLHFRGRSEFFFSHTDAPFFHGELTELPLKARGGGFRDPLRKTEGIATLWQFPQFSSG